MSHWTKVSVELTCVDSLKRAAIELGCQFLDNAEARGWDGATIKVDHVIKIPRGEYDVAVTRKGNKLELKADLYDGSVEKVLGKKFDKLTQLYATHKAVSAARRQGYMVQRKNVGDKVQLILSK